MTAGIEKSILRGRNIIKLNSAKNTKCNTVKPDLTTTCEQRPPVNNGHLGIQRPVKISVLSGTSV
jgi:hypothetical protein